MKAIKNDSLSIIGVLAIVAMLIHWSPVYTVALDLDPTFSTITSRVVEKVFGLEKDSIMKGACAGYWGQRQPLFKKTRRQTCLRDSFLFQ